MVDTAGTAGGRESDTLLVNQGNTTLMVVDDWEMIDSGDCHWLSTNCCPYTTLYRTTMYGEGYWPYVGLIN